MGRHTWYEKEGLTLDDLRDEVQQLGYTAAAAKLGVPRQTLWRNLCDSTAAKAAAAKAGTTIKRDPRKSGLRRTPWEIKQGAVAAEVAAKVRTVGLTGAAKHYGVTKSSVRRALDRAGVRVDVNGRTPWYQKAGLTPDDVLAAVKKDGVAKTANRYGVVESTVRDTLNRNKELRAKYEAHALSRRREDGLTDEQDNVRRTDVIAWPHVVDQMPARLRTSPMSAYVWLCENTHPLGQGSEDGGGVPRISVAAVRSQLEQRGWIEPLEVGDIEIPLPAFSFRNR